MRPECEICGATITASGHMCSGAPPASNLPREPMRPPILGGFSPDPFGIGRVHQAPPVDWARVARDAAVRWTPSEKEYAEASETHGVSTIDALAAMACDRAIALVAEMRRRAEFGGGT